ncbi:TPA: hypothetical protein DCW61_01030 [Candidatus Uhrbacteria bacterium]|nr:hypothetical protein [Candidatus Uhrbacteria bacterium]
MEKNNGWKPTIGIDLEDDAFCAIYSDKCQLITAGPGAGKTELLAQMIGYVFSSNRLGRKKVLAISFKKDSAKNLLDRVIKRNGNKFSDAIDSLTYDAFFKSLMDRFLDGVPEATRPTQDYILDEVQFKESLQEVVNLVFDNSQIILNNIRAELDRTIYSDYGIDFKRIWKKLIDFKPSRLTFSMITNVTLLMLRKNPLVNRAVLATYEYIFLDEFQDTTSLQYEVIKQIFKGSEKKIVAVGDDKQKIMTWAGADSNIFGKFKLDFHSDERFLYLNHRSSDILICLQRELYSILEVQKVIDSSPINNDGEIKLINFQNNQQESTMIAKKIKTLIDAGVSPNEIVILSKQKPETYAEFIMIELANLNINARVETVYQDLIKENAVQLLLGMLMLVYKGHDIGSWSIISDYFRRTKKESFSLNEMKILDSELIKIKGKFLTIHTKEQLNILLSELLQIIDVNNLKGVFSEYSQGTYLDTVLERFSDLFLLEIFKNQDKGFDIVIQSFLGEHSLPIMTIHKSKGLEFHSVFFIGLEDSAFWNFRNQPLEDKRAFFVAVSRAKKNLYFTYCSNRTNIKNPAQAKRQINEIYAVLLNSKYVQKITV